MPVLGHRLVLASSLTLLWAVSCAVFPDEAVLPAIIGGGSQGGSSVDAAGNAGETDGPANSGGGGHGPTEVGGAAGETLGGHGGVVSSAGAAGEGGVGGMPTVTCDAPQQRVWAVAADTWIGAAKPGSNHHNEKQLLVAGGVDESRTLLRIVLPMAPTNASLIKATLQLNLESNADASLAERHLELRQLTREFTPNRANWTNFSNGANNKWLTPGGDLGDVAASATISGATASGTLAFDVTTFLAPLFSSQAVPLSLIILENGTAPAAPAELAFTALEGDASVAPLPALLVEFCLP